MTHGVSKFNFKRILVLFLMSLCFHHVTGVINKQDSVCRHVKQQEQRFIGHYFTWDNEHIRTGGLSKSMYLQ